MWASLIGFLIVKRNPLLYPYLVGKDISKLLEKHFFNKLQSHYKHNLTVGFYYFIVAHHLIMTLSLE